VKANLKLNKLTMKKASTPLTQKRLDALNTLPDTPAHMGG
jgi:sulfatase modifying factor 1